MDTDLNPAEGPFAATMGSFMALPRYGRGDEIAGMVAYLASPEAAFVTGACLMIDGGFSAPRCRNKSRRRWLAVRVATVSPS